jgi:hypothetical protein
VEQVMQWEVDTMLEALQSSTTWVPDLMLEGLGEMSSLAASLYSAVELIEDRLHAVTANGVHWGIQSVLVAALSHFPKLETELELLGSRHNADLMED